MYRVLYSVDEILCIVLYCAQCIVHHGLFVMYCVFCIMYCVVCVVYIVYCALCICALCILCTKCFELYCASRIVLVYSVLFNVYGAMRAAQHPLRIAEAHRPRGKPRPQI